MGTIARTFTLTALLCLPHLGFAQEKHSVFVGAATEGASKSKTKELYDSANDLREEIEKRSNLTEAEHPEAAEILLTVLDRRIEVRTSGQTSYGGGNTQSHYQSRYILKYRLESGSFAQDAEYVLAGAFVTWKRMASGISKDIERWVEDNEELAQQRKAASPSQ